MPMSKAASARVARRIATAAAFGGGGISLLGGAAVGLLLTEARLAKRKIGGSDDEPPPRRRPLRVRVRRARTTGAPLRLGFLGDSTAAGQGVHRSRQTPGALLASALAAVAERPVELRNVALPGAQSDDLERQVDAAAGRARPRLAPDVCVIMIGANDVTHRMPPARAVRLLSDAVRAAARRRLRGGGRHLPRPRLRRAGLPAAALGGPAAEPAAGRGADHRRGRGGRPHGLAGRPAGPGVRGQPAGAVRPGQLPPVGRGLRDRRDGRAADAVRLAGPVADGGRAAGRAPGARASCRWRRRPPRRPPRAARRSRGRSGRGPLGPAQAPAPPPAAPGRRTSRRTRGQDGSPG